MLELLASRAQRKGSAAAALQVWNMSSLNLFLNLHLNLYLNLYLNLKWKQEFQRGRSEQQRHSQPLLVPLFSAAVSVRLRAALSVHLPVFPLFSHGAH
mmetsp:Transcript_48456/g.95050  ORF Transcript_48456/g.95050 Transcript_48456/m.95050 type:complete len:98 (-) Transcript_48456:375-668(-)